MSGEFEARIRAALSDTTDYVSVEREAWTLLERVYPGLAPMVGGTDRGRDAVILDVDGRSAVVSVSAEADWVAKLRADLTRASSSATTAQAAILCTTREVTARKIGELEDELGLPIYPHGLSWWVVELAKDDLQTRDIRRRLLNIGPRSLTSLLSPDEYTVVLDRRLAFVDAPLIGRDIDLESLLLGVNPGGVVLLVGRPGVGKSRFLIEVARRIGPSAAFIRPDAVVSTGLVGEVVTSNVGALILDDANQYPALVSSARTILEAPEIDRPPSLILGTWPSGITTVVEALHGYSRVRQFSLGPLPRRDIAKLLESEPISLQPESVRTVVAAASGGLPVAAVLAAEAIKSGADPANIADVGPLSLWLDSLLARQIGSPRDAFALASMALVSPFTVSIETSGEDDLSRLAGPLGRTRSDLIELLEALVSIGLADLGRGQVRIVPETAARHLLASLFADADSDRADLRRVLESFASTRWETLAGNLARLGGTPSGREATTLAIELLPPWRGGTAFDAVSRLRQLKSLASGEPLPVLAEVERILDSDLQELSIDDWQQMWTATDAYEEAAAVLRTTKYRAPTESIQLLIRLADDLGFERDSAGRVKNAALNEIAAICKYLPDPPESRTATNLRGLLIHEIESRWTAESQVRVNFHILAAVLDPELETSFQKAESPYAIQLVGGAMPFAHYEPLANAALEVVAQRIAGNEPFAWPPLLDVLDSIAGYAAGRPGIFGVEPKTADLEAYARVGCRLLEILRGSGPTHPGVQFRLFRCCLLRWTCTARPNLRAASEMAVLAYHSFRPSSWELSEKRTALRMKSWVRRWGAAGWWRATNRIRALAAMSAEVGVNAFRLDEVMFRLALETRPDAVSAVELMLADQLLRSWAGTPLYAAVARRESTARPQIAEYVRSPEAERRQIGITSLIAQDQFGGRAYGALLKQAIKHSRPEDIHVIGRLGIALTPTRWARQFARLLVSSSIPALRWLGLSMIRVGRRPRGSRSAIYLPTSDWGIVLSALDGVAGFSPGKMYGSEPSIAGVLRDAGRAHPALMLDWATSRLLKLNSTSPDVDIRHDVFSDDEIDAFTVLSDDPRLGARAAAWFETNRGTGFRLRREAPGLIRAVLGSKWGARVAELHETNILSDSAITEVIREAPFGDQWIEAARGLLERGDSRAPALVAALAEPSSWVGSPAPQLRERADALAAAAAGSNSIVAEGLRKTAEFLASSATSDETNRVADDYSVDS